MTSTWPKYRIDHLREKIRDANKAEGGTVPFTIPLTLALDEIERLQAELARVSAIGSEIAGESVIASREAERKAEEKEAGLGVLLGIYKRSAATPNPSASLRATLEEARRYLHKHGISTDD